MALTMKMKKSVMVVATQSIRDEGQRLVLKRNELIQTCINIASNNCDTKMIEEKDEIIHDTDSFPNYWFGNLSIEKKEDLIKINNLYFIGIETLVKGNRELEKLIARNTNKESKGDAYFRKLGEGMSGVKHKETTVEPVSIQKSVDADHVSPWRKSTLELVPRGVTVVDCDNCKNSRLGKCDLWVPHRLESPCEYEPIAPEAEKLLEGEIDWDELAEELHSTGNASKVLENKTFQNLYCHPIEKDCKECGNPFSIILAPDVTIQTAEELNAGIKICKDCDSKKFSEPEYIAEPAPEVVSCSTCKHAWFGVCKSEIKCKWNQGWTSVDKFNCPGRCVGCEHVQTCEYAENFDEALDCDE